MSGFVEIFATMVFAFVKPVLQNIYKKILVHYCILLASTFLTPPPTTTDVERLFSISGKIAGDLPSFLTVVRRFS